VLQAPNLEWWVVAAWVLAAFAVNLSVHSYLILAYAGSEKVAEDVGLPRRQRPWPLFGTRWMSACSPVGGLLYALVAWR
jgi:hypothetical protein